MSQPKSARFLGPDSRAARGGAVVRGNGLAIAPVELVEVQHGGRDLQAVLRARDARLPGSCVVARVVRASRTTGWMRGEFYDRRELVDDP
jgi:hypothetical protein